MTQAMNPAPQTPNRPTTAHRLLAALAVATAALAGCEADSYFDPSVVGRWERTPVVLPILDQIDIIESSETAVQGLSSVHAEDLIPIIREYVISHGDIVSISVFELMAAGQESAQSVRVDDLGRVRLPLLGSVHVAGLTARQLEVKVRDILEAHNILRDALVTVIVQNSQQNTFSVIGEPRTSGTNIGTYVLPKSDFRMLDAMALARGVSGSIKTLFVIRQIMLADPAGQQPRIGDPPATDQPSPVPADPTDLIEQLLKGSGTGAAPSTDPTAGPPPLDLDQSLQDATEQPPQWINIDGQWVRLQAQPATDTAATQPANGEPLGTIITQRVIEVPYDKLLDGDMRYNIVIRPGDIIRVPPPVIGNVYIGGAIARPGTYALPGDKDLTLKQLIFAAGNISGVAIPERVDLIRRVGKDSEATVRLNLRAIFEGTQPDFYLKPNDTINIGTSFVAQPLAVIRNGLRFSYGFGFILDRNFGGDVFGAAPRSN